MHSVMTPNAVAKYDALLGLWRESLGQLRGRDNDAESTAVSSRTSTHDVLDPITVPHSRLRLRLDVLRNSPGIVTGVGIVGTFSGPITGLRTVRISQDPAVVQRSLQSPLSGV